MFPLGFFGTCIVIYILLKCDEEGKVQELQNRVSELESGGYKYDSSEEDYLLQYDREHYDDEY